MFTKRNLKSTSFVSSVQITWWEKEQTRVSTPEPETRILRHMWSPCHNIFPFWISVLTAIDVNVSMPLYHMVDDYGIAGVISAK